MSSAVALKNPLSSLPHQYLADRYELVKILGKGGCSIVYLAIDHKAKNYSISPYVAVKILRSELHAVPEVFHAFQQEYKKAQHLRDPAVVKIHSFYQQDKAVFLVMEALEGKTLGQLFRQYVDHGLPMEWRLLVIKQLLAAVRVIHEKKWIHYDLKPGNLLWSDKNNQLKILDIGMACEQQKNTASHKLMEAITPAYASLEMILGAPADFRDDIYSVACVIYELLAGKHPFDRLSADQALKANMQPEPIASLTSRQWKVLKKALAFKRKDRLSSIKEFQQGFSKPIGAIFYGRLFLGCGLLVEALLLAWTLWWG